MVSLSPTPYQPFLGTGLGSTHIPPVTNACAWHARQRDGRRCMQSPPTLLRIPVTHATNACVRCCTGDWTFHLWRVGTSAPIFTARSAPEKYTAAAWSPTREGVLFLGLADGTLQCWDLVDRSHEASLSAPVRRLVPTCRPTLRTDMHGLPLRRGLGCLACWTVPRS